MTNGPTPAVGLLRTTDGGQTWSPVAIATATSTAPTPDLTARYPDGIPSTFLGQHVYRPRDLLQKAPTGPLLLGGWDAGAVVSACMPMIKGASNPPCPTFEALAETRGGPMVIAVRLGSFSVHGSPALVLRVIAEPAPTCTSIPPGGCPGPSVTVEDVLWAGDPLPKPGGTCSASQLVVDTPTWAYGYGTVGTTVVFGTLPLRNVGADCVMALPAVIGVAAAGGPFHAVAMGNTGTATSWASHSGDKMQIMLSASWRVGGQTQSSVPPCTDPIDDVTRLEIPLATGTLKLDSPIALHEVCTSPASLSMTFETK